MRWPVALLPLLVLAACPDDGVPDAAVEPCTLTPRLEVRASDGVFAPIAEAADAELVLGFQGFRYVYLRVRLPEVPPARNGSVLAQLDGDSAFSSPFGGMSFVGDGTEVISVPLQFFFHDQTLPSLVGAGVTFTLTLGDAVCGGSAGGHVVLAYDSSCIEGPSGERVCADAGVPDGGTP